MNYTPRYTEWIAQRDVNLEDLPESLLLLITCYQAAYQSWENAQENDQARYRTALESTDAYIAACLEKHFGNPKSDLEEDKLKALLSKAADLDF